MFVLASTGGTIATIAIIAVLLIVFGIFIFDGDTDWFD